MKRHTEIAPSFPIHSCKLLAISVLIGASFSPSTTNAQSGHPSTEPFPVFDFEDPQKSIVVDLEFEDALTVTPQSVAVVRERTHVRLGDPPLLRVRVFDLNDETVEEFNSWHPLWILENDGPKSILPTGVGTLALPFESSVAGITVTDRTQDDVELATIDLLPATHDFCRDNPAEPECDGLANRSPNCDADGPYVAECAGAMTTVMLDGSGSSDPDQDPLSYEWTGSFEEASATGDKPSVNFSGLGDFPLSLTVSDDFEGSAMCESVATVVDTIAPIIDCNSPEFIKPPDAPISFTATANDICDGVIVPAITGYDCFWINPAGRRVDKTDSCVVEIAGDEVTIVDSGGVRDTIEWTVAVADVTGNITETTCSLFVAHPVACGVVRQTSAPVWALMILLLLALRIRATAKR